MESMEGKRKSTNAYRCKHYKERNVEECKINDSLRKKRARLLLKSNKVLMKNTRKRKEKENVFLNTEIILQ